MSVYSNWLDTAKIARKIMIHSINIDADVVDKKQVLVCINSKTHKVKIIRRLLPDTFQINNTTPNPNKRRFFGVLNKCLDLLNEMLVGHPPRNIQPVSEKLLQPDMPGVNDVIKALELIGVDQKDIIPVINNMVSDYKGIKSEDILNAIENVYTLTTPAGRDAQVNKKFGTLLEPKVRANSISGLLTEESGELSSKCEIETEHSLRPKDVTQVSELKDNVLALYNAFAKLDESIQRNSAILDEIVKKGGE